MPSKMTTFGAVLLQRVLDGGGDALAVRLLVVDHGHRLGLDLLQDELGRRRALLVVAADGTEDELVVLAVGDRRRGGRRRHHDHAFIVVDLGGGDGRARAYVAHHEADLVVDHAVGGHRALLRFAAVIDDHGLQLLAVDAAGGVDTLDRRIHALAHHVPILGDLAGGGADHGDLDRLRVGAGRHGDTCRHAQRRDHRRETKCLVHMPAPWLLIIDIDRPGAWTGNARPRPAYSRASIH
ncbi:Uncharacterised protein [Bordetella pertussis]|nr:Uncharacterised protein [Bordetella pertussis]